MEGLEADPISFFQSPSLYILPQFLLEYFAHGIPRDFLHDFKALRKLIGKDPINLFLAHGPNIFQGQDMFKDV